jgi:hypothetical protein
VPRVDPNQSWYQPPNAPPSKHTSPASFYKRIVPRWCLKRPLPMCAILSRGILHITVEVIDIKVYYPFYLLFLRWCPVSLCGLVALCEIKSATAFWRKPRSWPRTKPRSHKKEGALRTETLGCGENIRSANDLAV